MMDLGSGADSTRNWDDCGREDGGVGTLLGIIQGEGDAFLSLMTPTGGVDVCLVDPAWVGVLLLDVEYQELEYPPDSPHNAMVVAQVGLSLIPKSNNEVYLNRPWDDNRLVPRGTYQYYDFVDQVCKQLGAYWCARSDLSYTKKRRWEVEET